MENKLDLEAPIRTIIVKVLSFDPAITSVFGRTEKEDPFFKDLLTAGCDFYELLEVFANNAAISQKSVTCIIENIPSVEVITDFSDVQLRKMIPHWSPSRYHTASVEDVCNELKEHIEKDTSGAFIYNSNFNSRNKRVYNDTYVLIIANSNKYFFDINRKRAFHICNEEGESND